MNPPCQHDWQPLPKWFGRYRCSKCKVVGYRPTVIPLGGGGSRIIPYKCKCGRGATFYEGGGKRNWCLVCLKKQK